MRRHLRASMTRHIGQVIVGVLLLCGPAIRVCGQDPVRDELRRNISLSQCRLELVKAQANLELWRVGQLRKLREAGHASWLELATAETRFDQFTVHVEVTQKFNEWLTSELQNADVSGGIAPIDDPPFALIDLRSPGAATPLLWFSSNDLPSEQRAWLLAGLQRLAGLHAADGTQIEAAEAEVEKRETGLIRLRNAPAGSSSAEREQAVLESRVARCFLRLAITERNHRLSELKELEAAASRVSVVSGTRVLAPVDRHAAFGRLARAAEQVAAGKTGSADTVSGITENGTPDGPALTGGLLVEQAMSPCTRPLPVEVFGNPALLRKITALRRQQCEVVAIDAVNHRQQLLLQELARRDMTAKNQVLPQSVGSAPVSAVQRQSAREQLSLLIIEEECVVEASRLPAGSVSRLEPERKRQIVSLLESLRKQLAQDSIPIAFDVRHMELDLMERMLNMWESNSAARGDDSTTPQR